MIWQHSADGETWADLQSGEPALKFMRAVYEASEIPASGRIEISMRELEDRRAGRVPDREAAAHRVAREIASLFRVYLTDDWAKISERTIQQVAATLLAFPGGDAVPVAWRVDCDGHSEFYDNEADARLHSTEPDETFVPLYAAPVAGEAGALRGLADLVEDGMNRVRISGPADAVRDRWRRLYEAIKDAAK